MSNVPAFPPRRPASAAKLRLFLSDNEARPRIVEAAQSALDTADRLIALLDLLEVDPNIRAAGTLSPPLAPPNTKTVR